MVKQGLCLGAAVVGIFVISGCATMSKNDELSNQGLRNKISALEAQLSEKDDEINSLKESVAKTDQSVDSNLQNSQEGAQCNAKMIQTALTNAGYFQDAVDGKMGRKTRQAVRGFQKANNLAVDGRVGKNTWAVLKEYLDKKVK
jgi:peptidoglycan hydrolase-like protein with peptidoglycan-binding domain